MAEKPKVIKGDPASQRAYSKWYYQQNAELHKARARKHNIAAREKSKAFVLDYLLKNPCVDCGEPDPIVLEFDHLPGSQKIFSIGNIAKLGYSIDSIEKEIAKCEVRCANCHRRMTYKRAGLTHRNQ